MTKKSLLVLVLFFCVQASFSQSFIEKTKNLFTDKNKKFSGTITYEVIPEKIEQNMPKKLSFPAQVQASYFDFYTKFNYKTEQQDIALYDDGVNQSSVLLIKMGKKEYAVQSNNEEIVKSLSKLPAIKISETSENKEICGFKCKKILITSDKTVTEAYITNDLNIPNPNWHSQYAEIKGVLMEYTVIKDNFRLRYIAINVKPKKFIASDFQLPQGVETISQVELNKILQKKF